MEYKIDLLEGEQILWEGRPLPALKSYFFITWSIGWSIMLIFFIIGIIFIPLAVVLCYFLAEKAYNQRYYWVTNKRLVYRQGLMGYSVSSLPLERISDVVLTRGWLENQFGFSSLQVQTLAGQISRGTAGSEGDLKALENPEQVQQLILKLVKDVNPARL